MKISARPSRILQTLLRVLYFMLGVILRVLIDQIGRFRRDF